jgi:hypothetical protein
MTFGDVINYLIWQNALPLQCLDAPDALMRLIHSLA